MKFAERYLVAVVLAAALLLHPQASRADTEKTFHITPFAGWTMFDCEFRDSTGVRLEDGINFGGRVSARLASPLWLGGCFGSASLAWLVALALSALARAAEAGGLRRTGSSYATGMEGS